MYELRGNLRDSLFPVEDNVAANSMTFSSGCILVEAVQDVPTAKVLSNLSGGESAVCTIQYCETHCRPHTRVDK